MEQARGGRPFCRRPKKHRRGHGPRAHLFAILKTAGKLGRLPLALRMLAMLPESTGAQGSRPWSGVVLLQRR